MKGEYHFALLIPCALILAAETHWAVWAVMATWAVLFANRRWLTEE